MNKKERKLYAQAFKEGMKFADENPLSEVLNNDNS